MSQKLSKRSLNNLSGVKPILIAILCDAIQDSPHDFGVPNTGGVRTPPEQFELYKDGKSKCDGYEKLSTHQPIENDRGIKEGRAFDIFGYVNGRATWDAKVLTEISTHIISVAWNKYKVKLTWGGDWNTFKDLPHYQLNQ